jgi:cytochrome c biogenesis protein CcmG, thiol:disulfide interchange protein DsbE
VRRAFVLLPCLALLLAGCDRGARPQQLGAVAPDFTLQDSDHKVSLHDFRGKVVVLNFWAAYCVPCIEETPSLERLQQRLRDKGVVVVGVSSDPDPDTYHQFLSRYHIDFVTVLEGDSKTANLYGTIKIPETYIIDRQGFIRRKFVNAVDWSDPEIDTFLGKL